MTAFPASIVLASVAACPSGQTGPPVTEGSFFAPPNDEYCTFVDLTGCSGTLSARWMLYWPQGCSIPAQAYFRTAVASGPGCYVPGAQVGPTYSFTLSGAGGANVTHSSPTLANPGPGPYFVCINLVSNGTCPGGFPMPTPRLRWDNACDLCRSYNIYPGSGGPQDLCQSISGNPVMWVQVTGSVAVEERDVPGLTLAGARPNPAHGPMDVWFTLASGRAAFLEVFDVTGRRVARQAVGALGPGEHKVTFGRTLELEAGLYLIRLTQGETEIWARAAVVR